MSETAIPTSANCPACKAVKALGMQCNYHRVNEPNERTRVNHAAAADYLANGPLGAEKIAAYDAAARKAR